MQALQAAIRRLDALPRRDRQTLLGGLLAAAVGVHMVFTSPLHDKRQAIVRSAGENDQQREQAIAAAADERTRTLDQLRRHAAELETQLATLGLKATQHEPVDSFIRKTARTSGAHLASLTTLPVEAVMQSTGSEGQTSAASAGAT
ncbi:MAG TPA: hypothetical protein VIY30_03730, partial [Burkholderiaceae bacterium]